MEVEYAYQELDNIPDRFEGKWSDRRKPWGTGHAILAAKDVVYEPFVVINADDYYGKEGFVNLHDYIVNEMNPEAELMDMCMSGFKLVNTLSENGGVTRGVCNITEGYMTNVIETYDIRLDKGKLSAADEDGAPKTVAMDSYVSMNMWGLPAGFMNCLESRFEKFLEELSENELKKEFLVPIVIDDMIKSGEAKVKMLETNDKWFGVTYKEDKPVVVAAIRELIEKGLY